MKRYSGLLIVLVILGSILVGLGVPAVIYRDALFGPQVVTNLLQNGGFEGEYQPQDGIGEVRIAPGWRAWYSEGWTEIPGIEGGSASTVRTARPEYRAATLAVDAYRVHSGTRSQLQFNFSKPGYAGIYQQVSAVKGATYEASVWAQCWASNEDGDPHSCPWELYISIGIDPDGGTWFKSRSIQWGQWQRVEAGYKQFTGPAVVSNGDKVTVYFAAGVKYAGKHGDIYYDDALMVQVAQGTVCPTPEPCPECPSCPACPTPEPCPGCPIPGGECDYDAIRGIVREELDKTKWGAVP